MNKLSLFLIASLLFASSWAVAQRTGDFSLVDQQGVFHQMSYYNDYDFVVLIAQGTGDNRVLLDETSPYVQELYAKNKVTIFLVNPTSTKIPNPVFPTLIDDNQLVSNALGFEYYGDTVFLNPKTLTVNTRVVGNGRPISYNINTDVSYAVDVAPVLAENCATCHRAGGIAPFALDSAAMAKAWSPMIREVLMTKRMPPGQLDPKHLGEFTNGRVLDPTDINNVVQWVNNGANLDGSVDILAELTWPENEWVLGEPDLIIELPPQEIPATGMIPYRYLSVTLDNHTEDRWIRASQYLPGDRTVLHHTLHTITAPGDQRSGNLLGAVGEEGAVSDAPQITAYVPGGSPEIAPENSGSLLKAGSKIDFQLHYTTNGKESIDVSRIGVWFYPEGYVPEKRMSGACACIFPPEWVNIPPNDPEYHMEQRITIPKDANIYSFLPHMHFRGKSMKFTAEYPDGTSKELINIANYNYAWQLSYAPVTPIFVPGGTVIRVDGVFDNSAQNPANPDHNRSVPWGQMSEDEMFFGVTNWQYINQ